VDAVGAEKVEFRIDPFDLFQGMKMKNPQLSLLSRAGNDINWYICTLLSRMPITMGTLNARKASDLY
jgi:hypothetical protein